MMKKITLLLYILFGATITDAQDIHFTQYYHSELNLNPAYAGVINGDLRVSAIYRTQWNGFTKGYNTFGFSVDGPLRFLNVGTFSTINMGLNIANDRSGDGVLNMLRFEVPIGFKYGVDKRGKHEIAIAVTPAYFSRSINPNALRFPNQFNYNIQDFDPNFLNFQAFVSNKYSKFDLDAGMLYKGMINEHFAWVLGGNVRHLIQPEENFLVIKSKLPMRMTFNAMLDLGIGRQNKFHIRPQFLYMTQATAVQTTPSVVLSYFLKNPKMDNNTEVFVGGGWRFDDSYHFMLGGTWKSVRLGMSYDYNISDLQAITNSFGAAEISLTYIKRIPYPIPPKTIMPCIRFL
jgi:type IX secretion system PorP/SprF family membrane protein